MDSSRRQAHLHTAEPALNRELAARTVSKLDRRILLLSCCVVFLSYVNRGNIGYAAKDLCNDLNLTHKEFGLGVSLFYAGYITSQVGSTALLKRFGAPRWMAVMTCAWGCAATTMGFVQNTLQLYLLRILLGIAEGGVFPGVWYYLSLFYPEEYVSNAYSVVAVAMVFSMPISAPISAGILSLDGVFDVDGWRLLFIVEGVIPIFFSLVLYFLLPRNPQTASFLNTEEKSWIDREHLKWQKDLPCRHFVDELKKVFRERHWLYIVISVMLGFGMSTAIMFWTTLIIHDMLYGEDSDSETCGSSGGNAAIAIVLTAVPYAFSGFLCLWIRKFDIRNRSRTASVLKIIGGLLLLLWVVARKVSFATGFIVLNLSIGLTFMPSGLMTALALSYFDTSTRSTAGSVGNTLASVGTMVFPVILGIVLDNYGYNIAMLLAGSILSIAGLILAVVKDPLNDGPPNTEKTELLIQDT